MSGFKYGDHTARLGAMYNSIDFEANHARLLPHLPERRDWAADIGFGSQRDALGLSKNFGYVVAIDSDDKWVDEALAAPAAPNIVFLNDSMPRLGRMGGDMNERFDLILLCCSWMHVPPADRPQGLNRFVELLAPNGVLAFVLRNPIDPARIMYPTVLEELVGELETRGLTTLEAGQYADPLPEPYHRPNVNFDYVYARR